MTKFLDIYNGRTVLVTGHTGFKGSWLSLWLRKLGAQVVGISIDTVSDPSLFKVSHLEEDLDHRFCDVRDLASVQSIISEVKPDFVFNLAAQSLVRYSYANPIETFMTNAIGTANILEALRVADSPCIAVMITSDKCYDNVEWIWGYRETDKLGGSDPYSASKGAAEIVINSFYRTYFHDAKSPVRCVSARAGNVIGGGDWAGDRIVPDAIKAWEKSEAVTIRRPNAIRPWQHVLEPLSGYLLLGSRLYENTTLNGESFNFGPAAGQDKTVIGLLHELARHWHDTGVGKLIEVFDDTNLHEASLLKLCCDKALAQLSWESTLDLEKCSRFTAEWYSAFYKSNADMRSFTLQQIEEYEQLALELNRSWIQE